MIFISNPDDLAFDPTTNTERETTEAVSLVFL
jgi:hypothetical protein